MTTELEVTGVPMCVHMSDAFYQNLKQSDTVDCSRIVSSTHVMDEDNTPMQVYSLPPFAIGPRYRYILSLLTRLVCLVGGCEYASATRREEKRKQPCLWALSPYHLVALSP